MLADQGAGGPHPTPWDGCQGILPPELRELRGSEASGLGFGVWGLGLGFRGLGFGVRGSGFGVWGSVFGVGGLGFVEVVPGGSGGSGRSGRSGGLGVQGPALRV